MARITDANKIEVLSDITITESSATTINIRMGSDHGATITIMTPSDATRERKAIREFIEKRQALIVENGEDYSQDLADVLDDLSKREEASHYTYGPDKGTPRPQSVVFWLDEAVAKVLAAALDGSTVGLGVSQTIREALTSSDTKGF